MYSPVQLCGDQLPTHDHPTGGVESVPPHFLVTVYTGKIAAFFASDSQLKIGGAAIFPGADCHQSSAIPPWPMCATVQGQTVTSHQSFHPGLCVPLSRVQLSRLRLTQQSLKRVGHEGKLCLKVEQRHPPCLIKVPLS